MKYTAINIGPIIGTLGMARKPRELWAASFLFSHLMKCIYEEAEKVKAVIISPAKPKEDKNKVGIYPDRIYFKGNVDVNEVISNAVCKFYTDLLGTNPDMSRKLDLSYFNLMSTSCDKEKDSVAISQLNQQLDVLELCNYATDGDAAQTIYSIISEKKNSPLFDLADGKFIKKIKTIEDIAAVQRIKHPEINEKSHHRYFCVVQADGDKIGKTVSHEDLKDGQVKDISEKLVQFGLDATQLIEDFGGLPIYAGGDDLLFIAPVIGQDGRHIFKLLDAIENNAFKGVRDVVDGLGLKDDDGSDIKASLSFGISISYYKYPLYEALESARSLLFDKAKNVSGKNAIALNWRKHSGGAFYMELSNSNKELAKAFENIISASGIKESVVSAMGHKIREVQGLFKLWIGQDDASSRNENYFKKYLEYNPDKSDEKKIASDIYKDTALDLLNVLFKNKNADDARISQTMYAMLRVAKFIKGEEARDE